MWMFSIRIAAALGLLALPLSVWAVESDSLEDAHAGPKEAQSTTEIVKALGTIHRNRLGNAGGEPYVRSAQFSTGDIKVFVAWHCPFSGVERCMAYLYVLDAKEEVWKRQMSQTFDDTTEVSVEFGEKVTLRDTSRKVVYTYSLGPEAIDPSTIENKVSISLGENCTFELRRDGDKLLKASKTKAASSEQPTIKVKLETTTASPFPPPQEGATRPFLSVENSFDSTLQFRTLVRLKDSQEFFELTEEAPSLESKSTFLKCWDFDTAVDEVVLYDFKLVDEKAE